MAINHETTDRKVISVPKAMSAEISRYRFGREISTEAEAIRQLIEKGLEAAKAEGLGGGGVRSGN